MTCWTLWPFHQTLFREVKIGVYRANFRGIFFRRCVRDAYYCGRVIKNNITCLARKNRALVTVAEIEAGQLARLLGFSQQLAHAAWWVCQRIACLLASVPSNPSLPVWWLDPGQAQLAANSYPFETRLLGQSEVIETLLAPNPQGFHKRLDITFMPDGFLPDPTAETLQFIAKDHPARWFDIHMEHIKDLHTWTSPLVSCNDGIQPFLSDVF